MSRQRESSKVIFMFLHFLSTQLRRCLGKVCVGDPHGLHHLHLLLRLHHSPHHHPHLLHEAHQDNPTKGTYYVSDNYHKPAIVQFYINLLIPHRKDLSIIWKVFQVLSAQLDLQATLSRGGTAKSRGQMRRESRDTRLTIMVAAMVCDEWLSFSCLWGRFVPCLSCCSYGWR